MLVDALIGIAQENALAEASVDSAPVSEEALVPPAKDLACQSSSSSQIKEHVA